ncbi:hypothetical protein B6A10_16185 [Flavobacterium sp. L1I52]|uniref:Uncharacterized protein n=1 Tax=Flavobacterium pokkalii TaxID=1940408 RepID=A0ABR7UWY8_9FLAO|nr:hypothetical protein [Flavobacterium pokkalii]MBD0726711.1 hypothetical protein [Flavobacterium pokkalii]
MTTSEYIIQSKKDIKHSQSLNVTYELLKNYEELIDKKTDISFLQIIPVRIVASNESFFKETFSSLLNHNNKYLTNSKNLLKRNNIKIDIEDVLHISKSKFTIGDLVAYSLSYSSLETILKNFEEITGINVYKELENVGEYIQEMELDDNIINEKRPYEKGRILKNLSEIYECRNIICHDFLSASHNLNLNYETLRHYIMDSVILQHSINHICSKLIYNDIPLEFEERMEYFKNIIEEKNSELENLYIEIENSFHSKEQIENLKKNIINFNNYVECSSKDFGFWFKNEGIFDDLILENKIKILENRIEIIKEEIRNSS